MLSRKQLQLIQIARGLPVDQIIQRTGIQPQSLMALMCGNEKDGKDPSKLISQTTYDSVLTLLGINSTFDGLRSGTVIEWRYAAGSRKEKMAWKDAVIALSKDLFSDDIEIRELVCKTGIFSRQKSIVFLHDVANGVRIVISQANKDILRFLENTFSVKSQGPEVLSPVDYDFTVKLVENGVYRGTQFNIVLGGKSVKYNWTDVQAAAREFNYHTDDLINLMAENVRRDEEIAPILPSTAGTVMLFRASKG